MIIKIFAFAAVIVLTVSALTEHEQWQSFKQKHTKTYNNIVEEKLRYKIFNDNLNKIKAHNERYENGEVKYYLGVNKFADMTVDEFSSLLLKQVIAKPEINGPHKQFPQDLKVPDSIDWRQRGAVREIKDQGACGACWAFGTTGALEGQNFILNNVSVSLSERQLMDCSLLYGNHGCFGGLQKNGFDYVADYGIQDESSYPYSTSADFKCNYSASDVVLTIKGYNKVETTEEAHKAAIGTVGPITVSIKADPLQLYEGGIFDDIETCQNSIAYLNHAVLAVGYGTEKETEYWLVKNSWGAAWGEEGYFRLHKNGSVCGILLDSSYPTL